MGDLLNANSADNELDYVIFFVKYRSVIYEPLSESRCRFPEYQKPVGWYVIGLKMPYLAASPFDDQFLQWTWINSIGGTHRN